MGRGRQKAKATKQAREIKYFTPDTDLSALQKELASSRGEYPPYSDSGDAAEHDRDAHEDPYGR